MLEKEEIYQCLWNAHADDLNFSYDLKEAKFSDGETVDYTSNWYNENINYSYFLMASIAIPVGWAVYAFMTRCPNCKYFFAMKQGRQGREIGREATTWTETRELKDKKGNVYTYDADVSGDRVSYEVFYTCKHCGHKKRDVITQREKR